MGLLGMLLILLPGVFLVQILIFRDGCCVACLKLLPFVCCSPQDKIKVLQKKLERFSRLSEGWSCGTRVNQGELLPSLSYVLVDIMLLKNLSFPTEPPTSTLLLLFFPTRVYLFFPHTPPLPSHIASSLTHRLLPPPPPLRHLPPQLLHSRHLPLQPPPSSHLPPPGPPSRHLPPPRRGRPSSPHDTDLEPFTLSRPRSRLLPPPCRARNSSSLPRSRTHSSFFVNELELEDIQVLVLVKLLQLVVKKQQTPARQQKKKGRDRGKQLVLLLTRYGVKNVAKQ
ncbi:hypothetical protein Fmac_031844 [Flemingia macrophylla]|uniref:Uncharacterized protein n=1 Tax=Flemingia macrophylla TaxID=520843 RepID=A0ABD1L370_9FABA